MDELKAKMAQLEQMMQDLKAQMAAAEKAQPGTASTSVPTAQTPAIAGQAPTTTGPPFEQPDEEPGG